MFSRMLDFYFVTYYLQCTYCLPGGCAGRFNPERNYADEWCCWCCSPVRFFDYSLPLPLRRKQIRFLNCQKGFQTLNHFVPPKPFLVLFFVGFVFI
uniref:Putative secreted protein n=1 Tax=Anopheles marajoara TaxID=58244 RepID=A0A2M4C9A7_9DIPT